MNHNELIRSLLAMPSDTRKAFGSVDVRRDGTGELLVRQNSARSHSILSLLCNGRNCPELELKRTTNPR